MAHPWRFTHPRPIGTHPCTQCEPLAPAERWLTTGFFALLLALRVVYAFHLRADSDEPQHLHVMWAWGRGLLPYRDVFDNHPPLFHWLFAPIFHALGERADILAWMRLTTIPLVGVSLWGVYSLGRRFYSRRVAIWSALVAGFYPSFFLTSSQFRPDNLWTALWLMLLATLVQAPLTLARLFGAGLLLGALVAISMKTFLMICALSAGAVTALGTRWIVEGQPDWKHLFTGSLIAGMGVILVPGLVVAYFCGQHAWTPFYHGVFQHNFLPGGYGRWTHLWMRGWYLLPLFVCAYLASVARTQKIQPLPQSFDPKEIFFVAAALAYPVALCTCWPRITRQDWLPCLPLLILMIAGFIAYLPSWKTFASADRRALLSPLATAGLVGLEALILCGTNPPWRDRLAPQRRLVSEALLLTRADQFVMDAKGETIYRPRAFFYALEGLTVTRMHRGLIHDDIVKQLVSTKATVVHAERLPEVDRVFIRANYLPVGELSVLGQRLSPASDQEENFPHPTRFEIIIPARYRVMDSAGGVPGELDGEPSEQGRWLAAGPHTFLPSLPRKQRKTIVILARAVEQGFSPFDPQKIP